MSVRIQDFMDIVEQVDAAVDGARDAIDDKIEEFQESLGRELDLRSAPLLLKLQAVKPIVSTPPFAIVTRYADVCEVLDRHDRFTVALYESKMEAITGPFILGLDDTPLYRHDDAAVHNAIHREDLPRIGEIVGRETEARLAQTAPGDSVDLVELIDQVIAATIAEFFGVPGPSPETLIQWSRALFHEIFINVTNDNDPRERALDAAAQMRPYIDTLVAQRKAVLATAPAAAEGPADLLGRLIAAQGQEPSLSDTAIRHNLIGLITGWIPTVSKALILAFDELLHRPAELAGAEKAARTGDTETVAAYVFEAMRFKPQNSGLLRKCAESTVIAADTDRETSIERGAVVFAATQVAMMDPAVFVKPDEFRIDRPYDSYLHFGNGLHRCIGEPINRVQLSAFAAALLRRGPSVAGELIWHGPFPSRLDVRLN